MFWSIFTEEQVALIKQRFRAGEKTAVIAKDLNVRWEAIHRIKIGFIWKHVA